MFLCSTIHGYILCDLNKKKKKKKTLYCVSFTFIYAIQTVTAIPQNVSY
jgi:hypothetical protein